MVQLSLRVDCQKTNRINYKLLKVVTYTNPLIEILNKLAVLFCKTFNPMKNFEMLILKNIEIYIYNFHTL